MYDATTFYDIVSRFAKDFYVPDILTPSATCIFILESPHIQEVKHRVPAAGSSGATMSKHLLGQAFGATPIGLLLKQHNATPDQNPILDHIGLVNVCNVPLQKAAYKPLPSLSEFSESQLEAWFADMEYVRANNQRVGYRADRQNQIEHWLTENLREKLDKLRGKKITLIPCGRFAQKYTRLSDVHDVHWQTIEDVPHPSYNSWDRPRYQPQITAIRQALAAVSGYGTP
ncbi:hypothetical protein [Alicyclobacillus acidoterrestris]|uniref:Uncharacterized protein n=1 Tax=Alicyclobacillus acidoterrestris (strain ATCC 49025 / DSM 3922 / CIP 106132 / NCIMB 13137 / GD3B) TaxID=1356854 RepID=T0CZV3_ALIAG|nr:hypothetical protein [Alicyclobacillus acidoterrestris]EPZ43046.1 hypothetical protein N007_01515 [Alicyclobacillus acidoterrestris ATCC 49025]UNO49839.1 hypothetical protein K1I37_04840 [Alicyclobacillus acidoterrestris]